MATLGMGKCMNIQNCIITQNKVFLVLLFVILSNIYPLGRIRSRFQAISRHLCLGDQNLYETCLLEVLLVNRTLRSRR